MKTNATQRELNYALHLVNKKYGGNIKFRNITQISKNRIRFTLGVDNSHKPGSRTSWTGRRLAYACWHVHGDFFDTLFNIGRDISPQKLIFVSSMGKKIDINGGNWEDRNIGSYLRPFMYSEACNCN